jgi:hypothetical protein
MSRSMRERWHEAVKVALVGTARQTLAEPELDPFLAEAGMLAVAERAGALLPARGGPAAAAAPDEERPRATPAQTRQLELILAGAPALLPEWLGLCARAGRRVDELWIPELLEHGRTNLERRPALLAVLGARGRWLAAREKAWRWAVPAEPSAWETGAREERLAYIAELRARDPEAARARIAVGFADETPDDRAALVAQLDVGLADADEPFLEAVLDDRRKEVRLAAARLLARLPRSRLAARMAERGLALTPPEDLDRAALRDGIEPTPPRGEGARAFWLRQILAAAPLATWGGPAAALARAAASDFRPAILLGWAVAAVRQRDPVWAESLLGVTARVPDLVAVLPAVRREEVVAGVLGRGFDDAAWLLLQHTPPPWGERLVGAALHHARTRAVATEIALRAGPELIARLLSHAALGATLPVLERRAALHRAFQEPA